MLNLDIIKLILSYNVPILILNECNLRVIKRLIAENSIMNESHDLFKTVLESLNVNKSEFVKINEYNMIEFIEIVLFLTEFNIKRFFEFIKIQSHKSSKHINSTEILIFINKLNNISKFKRSIVITKKKKDIVLSIHHSEFRLSVSDFFLRMNVYLNKKKKIKIKGNKLKFKNLYRKLKNEIILMENCDKITRNWPDSLLFEILYAKSYTMNIGSEFRCEIFEISH